MSNEIATADLADERYAARAAPAILSQFMQRPPDYGVMLKHLTQALIGLPKYTVNRMADPRTGVAAKNEFFSLAAIHKWVADFGPQPKFNPFKQPEPEPQMSVEDIERCDEMWRRVKSEIKRAAAATQRASKPLDWKHGGTDEQRLEALDNLALMQPRAEEAS